MTVMVAVVSGEYRWEMVERWSKHRMACHKGYMGIPKEIEEAGKRCTAMNIKDDWVNRFLLCHNFT